MAASSKKEKKKLKNLKAKMQQNSKISKEKNLNSTILFFGHLHTHFKYNKSTKIANRKMTVKIYKQNH